MLIQRLNFYKKDGDAVKSGELLGVVTGDIRVLLSGERVALNYLQRMSGIATYTNSVAKLLAGTKTKLLDTRKQLRICVFSKNMQFASEADIITAIIYLMASF